MLACWPHPPHQQRKRAEPVFRIVQEWGRETSWEEVSPHNCTAIASEHDKQLQRVRLQTAGAQHSGQGGDGLVMGCGRDQ